MGPKLETETWQPGVIENKIKKHHTYLAEMNYWATLNDNNANDKNESDEEESNIIKSAPIMATPKSNKWTQRTGR
jgi:hypothetical protein